MNETVTAKNWDETKWLAKQVRPFLRLHLHSIFCMVAASMLTTIDPLILKWFIDDFLPRRRMLWLPVVAVAFLSAHAGRILFDSLGTMLSFRAIQKMVVRIRLRVLRHVQTLSPEYHDSKPVGETLHRLEQDIAHIAQISGDVIPALLRMIVLAPLIIITMFTMSVTLTCGLLPVILAFALMRRRFSVRLRNCSNVVQEHAGRVSTFLQEHLSAITQVQLLCREKGEARKFLRLSRNALEAQVQRKRTELAFVIYSSLIMFAAVAGILGYGGYEVINESLTVGALVAFYTYTLHLFGPVYGIVGVYSKLHHLRASLRRVLDILLTDATVRDRSRVVRLARQPAGRIEFKDVTFWYKPENAVLKRLNLQVSAGERLALVGRSGMGKTTIAKLVGRLYDVKGGGVFVDGRDIREIKLSSLRSAISVVPQDPVLFDGTVLDNLVYANPKAPLCRVKETAQIVQLEDLISQLAKGWDEPVGPRGSKLSGGERQRVAMARALLRQPRILILDEPTSGLDKATESCLLEGLNKHSGDTTIIIITHRLSAMLWADRIAVLEHGSIVEHGTHYDLHRWSTLYRTLCQEYPEQEVTRRDGKRN